MNGVSNMAVSLAALTLVAAAAIGGYLGYNRANSAPGGAFDESAISSTPTSVAAKTASPIPDSTPPPPVPDETFIRKIAREEVQAALHPKRAAPVVDDSSDSSDDSSDADTPAPPASPPATLVIPPPPSQPQQ